MNTKTVQAPIDVLAGFQSAGPTIPYKFRWNDRYYKIKNITLVTSKEIGNEKLFYFSATDGANAFTLSFHPHTLLWKLEDFSPEA